jgi:cytochrome c
MRSLLLAAALAGTPAAAMAQAPDAALAEHGRTLYESRCGACHSIQENRTGPKHLGVVGRRAGSVPGYDYSDALRAAGFAWTPQKLDQWLQGPSRLVPGTKMFFTVSDPADRAAIIAYLKVAR